MRNKKTTAAHACPLAQDNEERDRILLEQLPQVRYLARLIHVHLPSHVQLEDLVHDGVIGLIDALNKFDPAKHVQFPSYAKFRVRGSILDSLRAMDWGPRELRRKARRIDQAQNKLRMELNREPTESEVAAELHLELRELQRLLNAVNGLQISSFEWESTGDRKPENHVQPLYHPPETPFRQCLRSEMGEMLNRAVAGLPKREQQVLALYYGEELTMKQVGSTLGLSESRVSQVHSAAVEALRARLADRRCEDPQPAAPELDHEAGRPAVPR